jgi:hypothetical protein
MIEPAMLERLVDYHTASERFRSIKTLWKCAHIKNYEKGKIIRIKK